MKISIVTSHPIQYQVPWFIALSNRPGLQVKVYFGCLPNEKRQGEGFDRPFKWDIPMYDGYDWQVLENCNGAPSASGFFSNRVRGLIDIFRTDRPDVVILTGWQALPLLQALWACIRLRIPCVVRGESSGLKPRGPLTRLVHRLLLSQFNAFLVIGKANRKFYTNYGIEDSKLISCPYFVDNERMLEQARNHRLERQTQRARWKIPRQCVCYLYVGKLVHKKHVLDQLEALKLASSENPNLHLLIVGTGELMEQARQFSEAHELPVSFAGFLNQTEITLAYVTADCLLVSSDYDETWGLVVNEAMICRLPVIASDRTGCGMDLVRPEETGEVFPFGDIEALSELMVSMARDPERLVEMGKRARDLVLRNYTPEIAATGTVEAVETILGRDRILNAN